MIESDKQQSTTLKRENLIRSIVLGAPGSGKSTLMNIINNCQNGKMRMRSRQIQTEEQRNSVKHLDSQTRLHFTLYLQQLSFQLTQGSVQIDERPVFNDLYVDKNRKIKVSLLICIIQELKNKIEFRNSLIKINNTIRESQYEPDNTIIIFNMSQNEETTQKFYTDFVSESIRSSQYHLPELTNSNYIFIPKTQFPEDHRRIAAYFHSFVLNKLCKTKNVPNQIEIPDQKYYGMNFIIPFTYNYFPQPANSTSGDITTLYLNSDTRSSNASTKTGNSNNEQAITIQNFQNQLKQGTKVKFLKFSPVYIEILKYLPMKQLIQLQQISINFYKKVIPICLVNLRQFGRLTNKINNSKRSNIVFFGLPNGKCLTFEYEFSQQIWKPLNLYLRQIRNGKVFRQMMNFQKAQWPKSTFLNNSQQLILLGGYETKQQSIFAKTRASAQNFIVNVKNGWCIERRPMKTARFSFGVCSYLHEIYVVSGMETQFQNDHGQNIPDFLLSAECYNTLTDQWRQLKSLPWGRSNPNLFVFNNWLICFGGICSDNRIIVLDLTSDHKEEEWIILDADIIGDIKQCIPNYGQMACLQIINEADTFEALLLGGVDKDNKLKSEVWRLEISFQKMGSNEVDISYKCTKEEAQLSQEDRFFNNHFFCDQNDPYRHYIVGRNATHCVELVYSKEKDAKIGFKIHDAGKGYTQHLIEDK